MNVGIIGYGHVGKSVHNSLPKEHTVYIYDPALGYNSFQSVSECPAIFICVPTPTKAGKQDHCILFDTLQALREARCNGLIIIKSTTLPKTMKAIYDLFKDLNIMCAPEFLDQATYLKTFSVHLIGVKNIFQAETFKLIFENECFDYSITDPITACMVKYVHNNYGALRVAFWNEVFDACEEEGVNYREITDKIHAVNNNYLKPYWTISADGYRGFSGACFPKDIVAFNKDYNFKTLQGAIDINKTYRKEDMNKVLS